MSVDSERLAALVVYFLAVVGLVALILCLSHLLGQRRRDSDPNNQALMDPFESGIVSVGDARLRFSAPFFLVAIFFVIFDLEAVFLFAWVIGFEESGLAGFVEAVIFIVILLAGLAYLWKLGALDWGRHKQTGSRPIPPHDSHGHLIKSGGSPLVQATRQPPTSQHPVSQHPTSQSPAPQKEEPS